MRATHSVHPITISSVAANVISGDTSYENPLHSILSIHLLCHICKFQTFSLAFRSQTPSNIVLPTGENYSFTLLKVTGKTEAFFLL
jgi:hypothetical protein